MAVKKKKVKRGLTIKQKKFAKHYAATGNGSKSAKAAGYSAKTADSIAYEILRKPEIKQAVHEALESSLAKAQLKSDHVVEQLRRIAFSDIGEVYQDNGFLKHPHEMSEEVKAAVQSIESDEIKIGDITRAKVKKLKMLDRTKALEILAKYFGLFTDGANVSLKVENTTVSEQHARETYQKVKANT